LTPEAPADSHVLDSSDAGGRFLRGGSLRLLAFAGGMLVGLGATPLVVHHLGAARWGDYGKVNSLLFIVAGLTEGGLGQMGLRELSVGEDPATHRAYMQELLGLRVALTLVGVAVAIVFGVAVGWGHIVVAGIAIAGLGGLLSSLQATLALPLGASLRLGWLAVMDFVPQVASACVMLALVLAGAGLLPFYCAPLAAGASALALAAWLLRREVPFRPRFPTSWRALLRQTFVYAVATATAAAYFRIALVATSLLSSAKQTGYYALSFRVLELTTTVPWLLLGSAFPILLRSAWNDSVRLRYVLQRLCEGSVILGGWFAFCLVIGAPFAIHVLEGGGNEFAASVPVLRTLGGAVAATFLLATFSYTLLSLQMYRELIVLNVGVIVLAFALSPLLIAPLGAEGAAILSVVLEVTLCVGYAIALFRARRDLMPAAAGLERVALALAATFGVGLLLIDHPVLGVLAGTAVLAAALALLRAVPAELLELVRGRR
jgi:O-antigen/teichoic acid export membrane protein